MHVRYAIPQALCTPLGDTYFQVQIGGLDGGLEYDVVCTGQNFHVVGKMSPTMSYSIASS